MLGTPYDPRSLPRQVLQDRLNEFRTELANTRTLLAHVRTGLACLVSGLALLRFFGHPLYQATGWILLPLGIVTVLWGIRRYRRMRRRIEAEMLQCEELECEGSQERALSVPGAPDRGSGQHP